MTPADQPPSSLAATVCARGCDFSQIQHALQASPPGATITVSAGTYRENLVIEKAVVLRGAGLAQIFTSWNPLISWLRQIERLQTAA